MKKTAKYYAENPEAKKKKYAYDKKHNAKPENVKKRTELNKYNREAQAEGRAKKGDGLDLSHTKNGLVYKKASINRASKNDQPGDKRARGSKRK